MRRLLSVRALGACALVLVAGCGSRKAEEGAAPVAAVAVALPRVASAAALAASDLPLPAAVVVLDEAGRRWVSAPPAAWGAPLVRAPDSREVDDALLRAITGGLRAGGSLAAALAEPLAPPTAAPAGTPPPPAPSPDDDDEEESGGTGTTVLLEEKPARAEGQYTMRRRPDPSAPAQRFAGAPTDGDPHRLATAYGRVADDGRLAPVDGRTLVAAAPTAGAAALVTTLDAAGGYLAVSHQGAVRVLRLDFARPRGTDQPPLPAYEWLEARLAVDGLAFEAVPEAPTAVTWPAGAPLAAAEVARAWTEVRGHRDLGARHDVDVLVDPEVDVQRLLDLLVALDAAGARVIGLGLSPAAGTAEATARGQRRARVLAGVPTMVGDLSKAVVREFVERSLPKIKYCYEKALAVTPSLAGTVSVQVFISPNGTVGSASGSGVSNEVSSCVVDVIRAIEFPKPGGGGGVQLNYPFVFRH